MIWKDIEGYASEFQISDTGLVRREKKKGEWRLIKPNRAGKDGRLKSITLWENGERKTYMLHHLYINAFKISEKDAYRILYGGFTGNLKAKQNIQMWLLEKMYECENKQKEGLDMNDELRYLKEFWELLWQDSDA